MSERKTLETEIDELEEEVKKLKSENIRMKQALLEFSDKKNWSKDDQGWIVWEGYDEMPEPWAFARAMTPSVTVSDKDMLDAVEKAGAGEDLDRAFEERVEDKNESKN